MKISLLLPVTVAMFALAGCSAEQEPGTAVTSPPDVVPEPVEIAVTPAPAPLPTTTPVLPQIFDTSQSIRTLMNYDVQPNADALWQAVRYVVTAEGVMEDDSPQTNEDWERLRESALALVAAGNALLLTNRVIDADYPRADYPDYTYTPDEIRALIDADMETWRYFIQQMQFATNATLETINNRDLLGLMDTGATINNACEGCHGTYWYRPLDP